MHDAMLSALLAMCIWSGGQSQKRLQKLVSRHISMTMPPLILLKY